MSSRKKNEIHVQHSESKFKVSVTVQLGSRLILKDTYTASPPIRNPTWQIITVLLHLLVGKENFNFQPHKCFHYQLF